MRVIKVRSSNRYGDGGPANPPPQAALPLLPKRHMSFIHDLSLSLPLILFPESTCRINRIRRGIPMKIVTSLSFKGQ